MAEGQALKALWLLLAYVFCVSGFGWLALAMEAHWAQVRPGRLPTPGAVHALRLLGVLGLLCALGACLRADHATMAALVWVMTLAAAALTVAFLLSWRPAWLAPLVFWCRTARPPAI